MGANERRAHGQSVDITFLDLGLAVAVFAVPASVPSGRPGDLVESASLLESVLGLVLEVNGHLLMSIPVLSNTSRGGGRGIAHQTVVITGKGALGRVGLAIDASTGGYFHLCPPRQRPVEGCRRLGGLVSSLCPSVCRPPAPRRA